VSTTYAIRNSAIVFANASGDVLRNRMTNVYQGIGVRGGSTVTASDNVIQTTFAPFNGGSLPVSTLVANWNDASDYVQGLINVSGLNTATLNLRCNWWGAASGPVGMPAPAPVSTYTPFATVPVAGQPHTGCAP
jgi:hypothetical protein